MVGPLVDGPVDVPRVDVLLMTLKLIVLQLVSFHTPVNIQLMIVQKISYSCHPIDVLLIILRLMSFCVSLIMILQSMVKLIVLL